jgi:predicted nucleic acid-binding protein
VITAVDTSVLVDVLARDPLFAERSLAAIQACLATGTLIASDVVWAEVAAGLGSASSVGAVMAAIPVAFSPVAPAAAERAGKAWAFYRRGGGQRDRIIADFLIGAHAFLQADRLLTRDAGFQRSAFGGLVILDPSAA